MRHLEYEERDLKAKEQKLEKKEDKVEDEVFDLEFGKDNEEFGGNWGEGSIKHEVFMPELRVHKIKSPIDDLFESLMGIGHNVHKKAKSFQMTGPAKEHQI